MPDVDTVADRSPQTEDGASPLPYAEAKQRLARLERQYLTNVLVLCDWNMRRAARLVGVHRNTIDNRMRRLGIHRPPRGIDG